MTNHKDLNDQQRQLNERLDPPLQIERRDHRFLNSEHLRDLEIEQDDNKAVGDGLVVGGTQDL